MGSTPFCQQNSHVAIRQIRILALGISRTIPSRDRMCGNRRGCKGSEKSRIPTGCDLSAMISRRELDRRQCEAHDEDRQRDQPRDLAIHALSHSAKSSLGTTRIGVPGMVTSSDSTICNPALPAL